MRFASLAVLFAVSGIAQNLATMPVVYTVPGMDAVHSTRVVYRTDGATKLEMDVYRPPNLAKNERRPAVIFVHGTADISRPPTPIDWGVYQSYGRIIGAVGLIGVTFNQRIADMHDGRRLGSDDVSAAIEYVRSHADEFQVDRDRLCLSAYSGGGPLLSVAIGDPQPYIRCLVGFYAVMDAPQVKENAAKLPPILIARAGADSERLNATIDHFIADALASDVKIEVHNIRGAPHAFDIRTPTPEVRGVIARTIEFMRSNLEK